MGRAASFASSRPWARLAFLLLFALLSRPAAAQCPPIVGLTSNTPVNTVADPSHYALTPSSNKWSAVAVRGTDISDWNIEGWESSLPFPPCLLGSFGSSATTGLDFLVTDWHTRPLGTDYASATAGGSGTEASVEFDQAGYELIANQIYLQFLMGSDQLVDVFETEMYAGIPYQIHIAPSAGLEGLKVLLFAPASGNGWRRRVDREVQLAPIAGTENQFTFTPTGNGMYGIVVANDLGTSGDYYICVRHCPFSAGIMSDNSPYFIGVLDDWPAFDPSSKAWGAVGVRGDPGWSYNLDVAPYSRSQYGPFSSCTDSVLASQYSGLGTRVIAGDFTSLPLRWYQIHAGVEGALRTSSYGWMEWDHGGDVLTVDAAPIFVTPPSNNVLDTYTVQLTAGSSYDFHLTPMGGTAAHTLLLFDHATLGSSEWSSRPDAVFTTTGTGNYRPHASGAYGVVIVNDNTTNGTYTLQVTSSTVGVGDPEFPKVSRLQAAAPNPTSEGARIAFELAAAGRVTVTVSDVSGRVVAAMPLGLRPAGSGSIVWDGRGADGHRMAAGIYLVTLSVDGRPAGARKLTLLD